MLNTSAWLWALLILACCFFLAVMEDKAYGSQVSAFYEVIFITNTVRTTQLITLLSDFLINRSNASNGYNVFYFKFTQLIWSNLSTFTANDFFSFQFFAKIIRFLEREREREYMCLICQHQRQPIHIRKVDRSDSFSKLGSALTVIQPSHTFSHLIYFIWSI